MSRTSKATPGGIPTDDLCGTLRELGEKGQTWNVIEVGKKSLWVVFPVSKPQEQPDLFSEKKVLTLPRMGDISSR